MIPTLENFISTIEATISTPLNIQEMTQIYQKITRKPFNPTEDAKKIFFRTKDVESAIGSTVLCLFNAKVMSTYPKKTSDNIFETKTGNGIVIQSTLVLYRTHLTLLAQLSSKVFSNSIFPNIKYFRNFNFSFKDKFE